MFASLRAVVPLRPLTPLEAFVVAELQANRLRELLGLADQPCLPSEAVLSLPHLRVVEESGMPVSGSTHWAEGAWVVTLNADEFNLRRRFSLMHELKHALDHTTKSFLYSRPSTGAETAERAADFFAGCSLMPKRWVKRLWGEGLRTAEELAAVFDVSPRAMEVRLQQIGLVEHRVDVPCARTPRVKRWAQQRPNRQRRYERARSTTLVGGTP